MMAKEMLYDYIFDTSNSSCILHNAVYLSIYTYMVSTDEAHTALVSYACVSYDVIK